VRTALSQLHGSATNPPVISFLHSYPKEHRQLVQKGASKHLLITDDIEASLKSIPSASIDLIVTDPPYNRGVKYGVASDRRKPEDYYAWCKKWLNECERVLRDTGTMYLISYPEINARLLPYIEDELGMKLRRWITWHYPTNIGHSKKNFTRSQRSILFVTKGKDYVFHRRKLVQHYKNPTVSKVKKRMKMGLRGRLAYDLLHTLDLIELNNGLDVEGMVDVLNINLLKNVSHDRFNEEHPCQLPLTLLRLLIGTSSNKNDVVLDPFAGTFTVSKVASDLGRNSVGIEINPAYVELGKRRLA
jgi:DNA modification methylase